VIDYLEAEKREAIDVLYTLSIPEQERMNLKRVY
jgi:hypothetical protein